MSGIVITTLGITALIINIITMFLTFDTKRGLKFSVCTLILFSGAFFALIILTDIFGAELSGLRGLVYLPVMILLFRGNMFQKIFAFFLQILMTLFQSTIAASVISLFLPEKNEAYYIVLLIALLTMYTGYVLLVFRFGRRIFQKLFIDGRRVEWILYAAGAGFSYAVITALRMIPVDGRLHLLLILFVVWSFSVLCFTIINAHEKSKQRFDVEFAREVISSGREHYQKMDELHDTLRTMRHDYKYHLIAIDEYLSDDNKEELQRYLDGMKTQLSESEIQNFCTNAVVNALLVRYAERCAKSHIAFTADIDLPDTLSVPNYDLCIMVGNLLENAVEACQKQTGGRYIEIILKPLGQQLALRVKNSYDGRVFESGGRLKSMKKDGGFGLRSIEAVAERYDGELLLDWEGGVFSAYVTMRL